MITKMSLAVMHNVLYYTFHDNEQAEEDNIQTAETFAIPDKDQNREENLSKVINEGQARMVN